MGHGTDAQLALAKVLGVAAKEILVRDRPIRLDDLRAAPSDLRAPFDSAREWQHGWFAVMRRDVTDDAEWAFSGHSQTWQYRHWST